MKCFLHLKSPTSHQCVYMWLWVNNPKPRGHRFWSAFPFASRLFWVSLHASPPLLHPNHLLLQVLRNPAAAHLGFARPAHPCAAPGFPPGRTGIVVVFYMFHHASTVAFGIAGGFGSELLDVGLEWGFCVLRVVILIVLISCERTGSGNEVSG